VIDALISQLDAVTSLSGLAYASVTILVAYSIFGLTGFGSSITAIPFLIHVFPLHVCVAVMLLFDLVLCALLNFREWPAADKAELKSILPSLVLGAIAGIFLSLHAPKKPLFLLLGFFIVPLSAVHSRHCSEPAGRSTLFILPAASRTSGRCAPPWAHSSA
jgi:uncharacterized membrane protein YfcA